MQDVEMSAPTRTLAGSGRLSEQRYRLRARNRPFRGHAFGRSLEMQCESSFVGRGDFKVQIRLGYELIYRCPQPTPMILNLNIHHTRAADLVRADDMLTDPWVPLASYRDTFGNRCTRLVAPAGRMRITSDAVIHDRGLAEPVVPNAQQHTVESLPEETLVYLLSSRYCDTEHLSAVAWNLFGNTATGWSRVQSICNFVNRHITFGYQFARPTRSASKAFVGTTRIWRSRYVDV